MEIGLISDIAQYDTGNQSTFIMTHLTEQALEKWEVVRALCPHNGGTIVKDTAKQPVFLL